VSLRLDDALLAGARERADELRRRGAKRATVTGVLERALADALSIPLPPVSAPEPAEDRQDPSAACEHPKAHERKFSWGVTCGDCGLRLR
jgi:hypothetical protein